jgi:hypothetical protein
LVPGAGDFWQIQIFVTGDPDVGIGDTLQHGVFGVRTVKGTHYWLRTGDHHDFVFNPELLGNLKRVLDGNGVQATGGGAGGNGREPSANDAIFTVNDFPYLNSNGCQ